MSRPSSRCVSCALCPFSRSRPRTQDGQLRLFERGVAYGTTPTPQARRLREAIAPYLCLEELRRLATSGADIHAALRHTEPPSEEIQALLALLSSLLSPPSGAAIRSAADLAARLLVEIGHLDHEVFVVVCLDTCLHVQRIVHLYHGTVNQTAIRVGEVFRPAIALNSASIIIAHNHPSGSASPSPEDITTTVKLREAGEILGIELTDHLIIAQGRWLSMRSERQGW